MASRSVCMSTPTPSSIRSTGPCLHASTATPTSTAPPRNDASEDILRPVPCRPARCLRSQLSRKSDQGGGWTGCHLRGLPREPARLLPASDPKSRVNHANIPATCGSCHGQKFVMGASGHSSQPFLSYQESVHGKAVAAGSDKAAVCTDCHGSHEILAANRRKVTHFQVQCSRDLFGKCHNNVAQNSRRVFTGRRSLAATDSRRFAPTAMASIPSRRILDPNSSVSADDLARVTCARCHEGVRLSQEFGVEAHRASTYLASYHGLASKLGSQIVANCASCHGVHNILPSTDPRSTINRANLVNTCGQCHPGVTEKFALSRVHVDPPCRRTWEASPCAGSAISIQHDFCRDWRHAPHNLLIWRHKALLRRKHEHSMVVRMTRDQRWQHIVLLTSSSPS